MTIATIEIDRRLSRSLELTHVPGHCGRGHSEAGPRRVVDGHESRALLHLARTRCIVSLDRTTVIRELTVGPIHQNVGQLSWKWARADSDSRSALVSTTGEVEGLVSSLLFCCGGAGSAPGAVCVCVWPGSGRAVHLASLLLVPVSDQSMWVGSGRPPLSRHSPRHCPRHHARDAAVRTAAAACLMGFGRVRMASE